MAERVDVRHTFAHPPEVVAAAVLDEGFQRRLQDLPKVAERRVTEQRTLDDGRVRRVVHYRFGADLPSVVVRAIGGDVVTWDEVGVYDPSRRVWSIEIVPKVFRGKFDASGTYRFVADGDGTAREVVIQMRLKVPVVGGRVERVIRDGLVEALDAEAEMLREYLA